MAGLKLGVLMDEKPVRVTVELPASIHRDLAAYAEILARETGQSVSDPVRLIAPMLARFIAGDRAFAKARRTDARACARVRDVFSGHHGQGDAPRPAREGNVP